MEVTLVVLGTMGEISTGEQDLQAQAAEEQPSKGDAAAALSEGVYCHNLLGRSKY